MGWEFTSEKPIHIQLVSEISNRIIKGEYAPGMKLPSVRDFAAQAAVNPNTMQRALSALEAGGLIFSELTTGRFVTNNLELIRKAKEELAKTNVKEGSLHETDHKPIACADHDSFSVFWL